MNNLFDLTDKVIIVTGGYGHLGSGIAKSLIDFGATVIIAGRSKVKFEEKFSKNISKNLYFEQFDISKSGDYFISRFREIKNSYGSIDVVFNNAHFIKGNNQENMPDEDWEYTMNGVLGSVHNKIKIPPEEPAEENFFKRIVTKEKLKISFDEENKAIIIETPGENMITMNDTDGIISIKDMNDNIVEMSADGVNIESAGDITINAKGNLELTSGGDIALKATGDVAVEGINIENKGQAKFAAEGAQCEVNGSAQTVIKGGMVMIN